MTTSSREIAVVRQSLQMDKPCVPITQKKISQWDKNFDPADLKDACVRILKPTGNIFVSNTKLNCCCSNVMRYADDEHELITRIANWGNMGHSQFLDGTQDTDNLGIIQ